MTSCFLLWEAVPVRGLKRRDKHIRAAQRQANFPAQQGTLVCSKKSSLLKDISKIQQLNR